MEMAFRYGRFDLILDNLRFSGVTDLGKNVWVFHRTESFRDKSAITGSGLFQGPLPVIADLCANAVNQLKFNWLYQ
jgi:hypothetical protein